VVMLKTRLGQTVTLVEQRVKNNKSEDPIKDLTFLSEHYRSKQEWDKANAATRHMLAVAEGHASSFEITPLDIELHQSKMHWKKRKDRKDLVQALAISLPMIAIMFAATFGPNCLWEFGRHQQTFDFLVWALPGNPSAYVGRAEFFMRDHNDAAALADCNSALALDPENNDAFQLKSWILTRQHRYEEAWAANELRDHSKANYLNYRINLDRMQHKHLDAARTLEKLRTVQSNWGIYWDICEQYVLAGRLDEALQCAKERTETADGDTYAEVQGWRLQARVLVALGRYEEAVQAASKSIELSPKQEVAPGYSLLEPAQTFRAEAYVHLKKYQLAVDDATAALNMQGFSYSYRALKARAEAYSQLGLASRAKEDEHKLFHQRREYTGEDI
jgi:tetratricopeptide (TPR) repeat protein